MQNPRIFQAVSPLPGSEIELDEHACKHLIQVLRLRPGDAFILFNGQGQAWQARLKTADKRHACATVLEALSSHPESPLAIHLGLGISRGERMDYAIQKAVELGVSEITPLFTRYSMVKLDPARQQKRLEHWQSIIISACEQCGRNRLPVIHPVADNDVWLTAIDTDLKLSLAPTANQTLRDIHAQPASISLYIGPEGGLSEAEIKQAGQQGFQGIRLGPRILRTETAVVAALSAVQLKWGDLS